MKKIKVFTGQLSAQLKHAVILIDALNFILIQTTTLLHNGENTTKL